MPEPWNKDKTGLQTAWNKGSHCSEETKNKISIANQGKKSWNTGKSMSEETKEKVRKAKVGSIPWNKGKKTGIIPKTAFKKGSVPKKPFIKGQIAWNKGMSDPAWQKENNANWKGGIKIGSGGYILINKPEHPFCDSQGYVKRSRLTMEEHIGRQLYPQEIVHHKGTNFNIGTIENKQDDRIENLQLFSNHSDHMKHHAELKKLRCVLKQNSQPNI